MTWAANREAIRQAIISATGITDVRWKGTHTAGSWRQGPHVDLRLRSPVALGVEETRYVYDLTSDELTASIAGHRSVIVEVRIESMDQSDSSEAVGTLAGRLRLRLRRPSILAALRVENVALSTIGPSVHADAVLDSREVSVSLTDVVFLVAESDTDDTDAGDYILQAEVTSEYLTQPTGHDFSDTIGTVEGRAVISFGAMTLAASGTVT